MKQYYETVDVKVELPKEEGPIRAIHASAQATLGLWYRDENSFKNQETGEWEFTHWLRPVSLSDLIREVAGKAWEAAKIHTSFPSTRSNPYPDKEKFINSLK